MYMIREFLFIAMIRHRTTYPHVRNVDIVELIVAKFLSWSLRDLKVSSPNTCFAAIQAHMVCNCSQMNAKEGIWWHAYIASGNGLVPSGNKP